MSYSWWLPYSAFKKQDVTKPLKQTTQELVFATFHKLKLQRINVTNNYNKHPHEIFTYGNAFWLTSLYFDGQLQNDRLQGFGIKLTPKRRKRLIEGRYWRKLLDIQVSGEKFLLRDHKKVLCGPDAFWDKFIIPFGQAWFWGTFVPEMLYLIRKEMPLSKILRYDFNTCPHMRSMRKQEKLFQDKIASIQEEHNGSDRKRSNKVDKKATKAKSKRV